jgi:hypothetical protein
MFRNVSNNCICRDMRIACWLEKLKERENLEGLSTDGREDNTKVHLTEI